MDIELNETNDYIKIDNKDQIKIVGHISEAEYFLLPRVEDACRVFGRAVI